MEKLTGDIGGGVFELKGGVSFTDFTNWHYDFTLGGTKLLLFRDPALKVRANVDFVGGGNSSEGLLKGTVSFVDSRIESHLEVTPLLVHTPATTLHPHRLFPDGFRRPFKNGRPIFRSATRRPVFLVIRRPPGNCSDASRGRCSGQACPHRSH